MINDASDARQVVACRACGGDVGPILVLGTSPLANSLSTSPDMTSRQYPLGLCQCQSCGLVQNTALLTTRELFSRDYPYLSSVSRAVRSHAASLTEKVAAKVRSGARALDIGSNDGVTQVAFGSVGIACFGVDPAPIAVSHARRRGCQAYCGPFDDVAVREVLQQFGEVDVITLSNVLAHVPDPAGLLERARDVLRPDGLLVVEVQSWLDLVASRAFDMVYHEHHAHFSLTSLVRLAERAGFAAQEVESIPAQGGSIRLWCRRGTEHADDVLDGVRREGPALERAAESLRRSVDACRVAAGEFEGAHRNRFVAGYGAAAKTVTLLSTCGSDLGIRMVADNAPSKIGRYLPLHGLPIVSAQTMLDQDPDVILLFAWNLAEEILPSLGGREVWVPIPEFQRIN